MDAVSKGDEELPASTSIGDTHCVCWSPKRSEEVCRCNYAKGHAIRDICSGDMKEKTRSSGLQNQNILGRPVARVVSLFLSSPACVVDYALRTT